MLSSHALLFTFQSIEHVPLVRISCSSRIRLRLSIYLGVILHIWGVPDYMPTLAAPIEGISTYQALTSMQTVTFTTRLFVTLGISIIALL